MTPEQADAYRAHGAAQADSTPPLTEDQAEAIARILAVAGHHAALELEGQTA